MKQTRNGTIDILKFLFCLLVALYYCYGYVSPREHWPLASVAVEFFVLTASLFCYAGWDAEREAPTCAPEFYPWKYAKKRFLRFFVFAFPAVLITIFTARIYPLLTAGKPISPGTIASWFSNDFWEMILIKMGGINNGRPLLNVPTWTMEAMLIAEVFVLCILVRNESLFTTFIAPVSILSGYGYWRALESGSNTNWLGLCTFGVLHVYLVMCVARGSYKLSQTIRKTSFTVLGKTVLTALETLGYVLVFLIAWSFESRYFLYFATLLLALSVAVTYSEVSYTSAIFRGSPLTHALAEVSFGVYVLHYPVIMFYTYLYPHETEPLSMILTMMGLIVGLAAAYTICVKILWKALLIFSAAFGRSLTRRADPDGPDGPDGNVG